MSDRRITRRGFIGTLGALGGAAAAGAAFTIVSPHALGGPRRLAPSDKLNIAGIGVGGMGATNLRNMSSENIVALCDVDHRHAAKTFKQYPKAKVYTNYREMLDKQKDIDAVLVATPDHTHAVIATAAMKADKHVYCQKPLCHDVYEARMLAKVAKEAGVCTQMGIQGHSTESVRLICEWIWAGVIGEVREVDAWCSLSYYPFGHAYWSSKYSRRPKDTPPVPEALDWDRWIGPAPMRPYHPAYHPAVWRCWWDFGSGMMGDRGAHTLDPVFWSLKLGAPTSIEATTMGSNADVHPLSSIVTYQFPARGKLPPVKLTWYEGTRAPRPAELEDGRRMGDGQGGVIFKGSKGTLMCGTYGNGARLIPESRMKGFTPPPKTLPRVKVSHEMDFVTNCKAGTHAGADFSYSGPLTEICQLGNVAKRVDARILWDAENLKVTNVPKANKYVRTEYRKGWSL